MAEKNVNSLNSINNPIMIQRLDEIVSALNIPNRPCGLEIVQKIESYLKDYQIMVVSENYKLDKNRPFKKYLYLALFDNHYYVIRSMKAYLDRNYYCDHSKH